MGELHAEMRRSFQRDRAQEAMLQHNKPIYPGTPSPPTARRSQTLPIGIGIKLRAEDNMKKSRELTSISSLVNFSFHGGFKYRTRLDRSVLLLYRDATSLGY